MLSRFISIFWRVVKKNHYHYALNAFGLAIGVAASLYLYWYCTDELTLDQFHPEHTRLYKVVDTYTFSEQPVNSATVSAPMGPALADNIPEIEMAVRLNKVTGVVKSELKEEDDFQFEKILMADSGFFQMFGFQLLEGNSLSALTKPNSVVLTETTAHKLFGDESANGKTIKTNLLGGQIMLVTGIAADPPTNSHIKFEMLVSHTSMINIVTTLNHWLVYGTHTYVRLKPDANIAAFMPKVKELVLKNVGPDFAPKYNHQFVPVTDLHLDISRRGDMEPVGNRLVIAILRGVALLIILLSVANFISLSLSLATGRVRESGVRKVLGSSRKLVVGQFISEGFLAVMFSTLIGIVICVMALPYLNAITSKNFSIHDVWRSDVLLLMGVFIISASFLSGAIPSFFLARLNPIASMRNVVVGFSKGSIQKVLVVFQFTVVSCLLIAVSLLQRQLDFLQSKNLGFAREGVVVIPINSPLISKSRVDLKHEFESLPDVKSVTASGAVPTKNFPFGPFRLEGESFEDNAIFNILNADADVVKTLELNVIAGRGFDENMASDSSAFMLNEAALDVLGVKDSDDILGKTLEMHGPANTGPLKKGPVVGVIQNFHYKSLREDVEPLVIHIGKGGYGFFVVRIESNSAHSAIKKLQSKWNEFEPNQSMSFSFLEDDLSNLYKAEQSIDTVFQLFTGLTILVAAIGLFGLSSYMVLRKNREIAIHKIHGAEVQQIIVKISQSFLVLMLVSLVIASPVAWYLGRGWLETFAFHTNLSFIDFLIACVMVLVISIGTIGFHVLRAACANPVKYLRSE